MNLSFYRLCIPLRIDENRELRFLKILDSNYINENNRICSGVANFILSNRNMESRQMETLLTDKFELDFCEISNIGEK